MAKYRYNPETLKYEARDESAALKALRIFLLVAGALALVYLYFWLYTSVFGFELPKTAILRRSNALWQARTEVLNRSLDQCEQTLEGIEERDDEVYRSIYGLSEVPDELKELGVDAERYSSEEWAGASSSLKQVMLRVDALSRRAYLQSKALDEVGLVARKAGDMVSCVPAVPPIIPDHGKFTMSSPFGFRTDPVYGTSAFHSGQDFAAQRGYPVFATGDGVVEKAEFKFTGYGNEIVIDHGYGYKSRYAHLNTMEVADGMKVTRGDKIGTVGNSGKSTGTHLHYEVEYKGEKVNPMNYMDINMPIDEYKSMVEQRSLESPNGKRSSTSTLIRKRNAQ